MFCEHFWLLLMSFTVSDPLWVDMFLCDSLCTLLQTGPAMEKVLGLCMCLCERERENYWPDWAESYHVLTCFKSGWWDLILSSVFHWHRQQDPALISVRRDCCRWHGSEKRSSDPPAAFCFSHVHLSRFSAEWWHHWSPVYAYQGFNKGPETQTV